ncbi:MAG TPA: hypothetical protein PLZ93_20195 [Nocardioides sp.]|uniref:hypothetical protein n=1 Tax=uncultured Nocardioides sp. TaxID=198441 RepID=UPI002633B19A|nr:hypothetical protein [uncultured Nocardioides sp.]HRI97954.1 hypothetical protein [Nocardioides sp.]
MAPPRPARALLLDLGGVVLRNGRELVRGSVVEAQPEFARTSRRPTSPVTATSCGRRCCATR